MPSYKYIGITTYPNYVFTYILIIEIQARVNEMQITQGNWQARINPEHGSLGLTRTEAVDMMLLAAGNTYKEIARATGRSPETVRGSLKKGYHKLDVYKAAGDVGSVSV
jgi:DNA-binding CsgD family transcriptional regulator